ncbi:hypothetical protein AB0N64_06270 [Microbacterium sp. NPDC089318]
MSVDSGRALYDQTHPTRQARAKARANQAPPKKGIGTVANGRALYDNKGRYARDDVQTGTEGTDV